jgi:dolichyl-phosphate-mannose--protein O-mannosyl transferase
MMSALRDRQTHSLADRRKELYRFSIITPFYLFAMDYLPFLVNETRCNYRCAVLNLHLGRDDDFNCFI